MKMIISVLNAEDAGMTIEKLNENNFFVTKLASSGGFLKKRNTTIMIGLEDDKVEQAVSIIKEHAGKRTSTVYSSPTMSDENMFPGTDMLIPVQMETGGCTIFILNVEDFKKL